MSCAFGSVSDMLRDLGQELLVSDLIYLTIDLVR